SDGVPRVDELPACLKVEREETFTWNDLQHELSQLKAVSPTRGALLEQLHLGIGSRAFIHYTERAPIILSARSYDGRDAAVAVLDATRRALPHFFSGARDIF